MNDRAGRGRAEVAARRSLIDSPRTNRVMLALGRAVVEGQFLEIALATTLTVLTRLRDAGTKPYDRQDFIRLTERLEKGTMGRLIGDLKDAGVVPEVADRLGEALQARNFIVHHFFREPDRSEMLRTKDGRDTLVRELEDARAAMRPLTKELFGVATVAVWRAGLTTASMAARADELRDRRPADVWEARVRTITSDPRRRKALERQLKELDAIFEIGRRTD